MAYSIFARPSQKQPGKFIGLVRSGRSTVVHTTEPMNTGKEAYSAAEAWRTANAAKNAAAKAAKEQAHMTCQCCGRGHLANTGLIAHHGYTRPGYGWQTASCYGARSLPWEVSRDTLGEMIAMLRNRKANMITMLGKAMNEEILFPVSFTDYTVKFAFGKERPVITVEFSRATFETLMIEHGDKMRSAGKRINDFDTIKTNDIEHRKHQIKSIADDINACQARYDGWKQTHKGFDKSSETWIKL